MNQHFIATPSPALAGQTPDADLPPLISTPPGLYRHYKGRRYQVLGTVRHSETLEPMTLYQALYGAHGLWVRPAAMFEETVVINGIAQPRFARCAPDSTSHDEQAAAEPQRDAPQPGNLSTGSPGRTAAALAMGLLAGQLLADSPVAGVAAPGGDGSRHEGGWEADVDADGADGGTGDADDAGDSGDGDGGDGGGDGGGD